MGKNDKYFVEFYTENHSRQFKIDRLFYEGRTNFQTVLCFSNQFLGKALFLDEVIQSAQMDEFIYHEALVQPAMLTHPFPEEVLVIGGGEGAVLREALRHLTVRGATMVDIDEQLIDICREFMPEWSEGAFSDSRTELSFADAREFLGNGQKEYDVIISDLTEPLEKGPSVYLFTTEFFQKIDRSLNDGGLFVLQAGSVDPFYCHFFSSCVKTLETLFPIVRPYWTSVPSFGLPWGFVIASKKEDPLAIKPQLVRDRLESRGVNRLKFYSSGHHYALFSLPLYLEEALEKGRILNDKEPFIWEL